MFQQLPSCEALRENGSSGAAHWSVALVALGLSALSALLKRFCLLPLNKRQRENGRNGNLEKGNNSPPIQRLILYTTQLATRCYVRRTQGVRRRREFPSGCDADTRRSTHTWALSQLFPINTVAVKKQGEGKRVPRECEKRV